MNPSTRLEQDLADWLLETAMPNTPDYADEILDQTARIRQRPRWTFLGRSVSIAEPPSAFAGRRVLGVVALLVALTLMLAAVAAFVGSRRTGPPPFGPAGAGLLAVSRDGDIELVDQRTSIVRPVVAQPAIDLDPRWSPDGKRLTFVRHTSIGEALVITDAAGATIAMSEPFASIDPDGIAWSPDGSQIAISVQHEDPGIVLVDAVTGGARRLEAPYLMFEVYWRPPDGRQLLFRTSDEPGSLAILSIDDGTVIPVPTSGGDDDALRPLGWTPDGRSVLYQYDGWDSTMQTVVVDLETGHETRLAASFGHVSNDGKRVAGLDAYGRFCVVAIGGGPCDLILGAVGVDGTHSASISWSPDDRWIAISESPVWLVDPSGAVAPRVVADGGPAVWQRTPLP